jgi:hypothetical protein
MSIPDERLPMSNGVKPNIGEIVALYPMAGGWQLWVGQKPDGHFAIDLYHPHPKFADKRGWFSVIMTEDLPLKFAKKLNFQPWVAEEARPDGTIGTICPAVLIRKLKNGSINRYVAVEHQIRHAGEMLEISRKSWTNEKDIALPQGVNVVFFDIGTTHKNDARISGVTGEPIKLQVAIVRINEGEPWPQLPEGVTWMTFGTYAEKPDGAGKDALFNALVKGLLD